MRSLRQSGSRGFSLLEMVIVMFIIMVLAGLAIGVTREVFGQEELRATSRKLALFAKTARQDALRENVAYILTLTPDRFILQPAEEFVEAQTESESDSEKPVVKPIEFMLPEKVKLKVKIWGSKDWEKLKEVTWTFTPTGLCAPHSFRLERDTAWMEMSFNPLTANLQDEAWYLP